jgi:myo-inositol-1(or 4)-monophosphatase
MTSTRSALDVDWLAVSRRATSGLRQMLEEAPSTKERARETGSRGSGGDWTLVIDSSAESLVLNELETLAEDGYQFVAVSEERGEIDYGTSDVKVIIDPIDGSLNAKRRFPHYALSIAVASGETMADIQFAYVYDFGPSEEWWAARSEGAWLNGERLDPTLTERRGRDGRLEMLGIESADPRWVAASIDSLVHIAYRLRAIGTIASALCQVAAARFDAMVSLRRVRAVDAAAGQLIVREAGGLVSFPGSEAPLGVALDAVPRAHLIAARSAETLRELEAVPNQ